MNKFLATLAVISFLVIADSLAEANVGLPERPVKAAEIRHIITRVSREKRQGDAAARLQVPNFISINPIALLNHPFVVEFTVQLPSSVKVIHMLVRLAPIGGIPLTSMVLKGLDVMDVMGVVDDEHKGTDIP
ncbi:unnamed protein product [Angiostrongylus costaricensis]|uniref:Secreted protein n=1 Tax=Angiostrongylus costaricensis TaxID=334426 RepID=A0A0R3PCC9_ANGCS|nr:unnamed protein product [Angiostrongylus costaricensis]